MVPLDEGIAVEESLCFDKGAGNDDIMATNNPLALPCCCILPTSSQYSKGHCFLPDI